MTDYTERDRVLALGGVFQATRIARDIARNGVCDAQAFDASRETLFDFDPESVEQVFGGPQGVAQGLRTLVAQIEKSDGRDLELSRYAVALLHLGDRLLKRPRSAQQLREDLAALARKRAHFELTTKVQHEQLAQIYQDHIGVLGPRIMVRGEPLHLQNPDNAARIRVALLSGIRASVLWRQAGGRKWQFLLRRRAIARTARELLHTIER